MTPFFPRSVLMAATALLASACIAAPAIAQQKASLVFSAGPTGGTWTPMAAATADVIKKKFPELDVQVEPGAALVNMEKIRNDKADLGWSMTTVLADARAGTNTWQGKQTDKPLYVASFYPNVWQLVVPQDSDVRKLADLKGKAVALPPRGNTSLAEGWELLLKASGMKLDDLGTKSFGSISENGELIKNRQAVDPGFVRHVIPKATYAAYGIDEDVVTIQAPTILIASSKTPPDVIYKVTKAIIEGRESFANVAAVMKGVTAKDMAQNFGLPYHPGAEKYYKEAGLLK
ncbi:MAG: hypothetical protein HW381_255 [Candidatus Rokubacteria bacterium]|nr:hypothetical protein [Candidatus Rokubacteria bacterium]